MPAPMIATVAADMIVPPLGGISGGHGREVNRAAIRVGLTCGAGHDTRMFLVALDGPDGRPDCRRHRRLPRPLDCRALKANGSRRTVPPMPAHTDIVTHGWVARLPRAWLPYILLARLDRPIGAWLLFLPGLWGILLAGPPPAEAIRLIVLFGIGSLVMRAAGCVVNDLWDRDIDRQVARTASRPLASGALRPWRALAGLAAVLLIVLAIWLQLNRLAQVLGAASLMLVALYPLAKRVTWWPQLAM